MPPLLMVNDRSYRLGLRRTQTVDPIFKFEPLLAGEGCEPFTQRNSREISRPLIQRGSTPIKNRKRGPWTMPAAARTAADGTQRAAKAQIGSTAADFSLEEFLVAGEPHIVRRGTKAQSALGKDPVLPAAVTNKPSSLDQRVTNLESVAKHVIHGAAHGRHACTHSGCEDTEIGAPIDHGRIVANGGKSNYIVH